ncbi:MAG TPA: ribose 5-phosphate isomerase A [Planctomycetota bacterium]|jgi:ribose 5-phosphate isomerase A
MAKLTSKGGADDPAVRAVAQMAAEMVQDGWKVGLGSGRASKAFIRQLGERVRSGLRIEGVPTSDNVEQLARELNIPLIELREDVELDIVCDGADEVAPNLDLVKGWGGAMVRERIVTMAAKRQIILVGPEKLVQSLGERGAIPVEIIPLSLGLNCRKLKELGLVPTLRQEAEKNKPFVTDNRNLILDCALTKPLQDGSAARALESNILSLAGVVDTGMFLGTASQVLVGQPDGTVQVLKRPGL